MSTQRMQHPCHYRSVLVGRRRRSYVLRAVPSNASSLAIRTKSGRSASMSRDERLDGSDTDFSRNLKNCRTLRHAMHRLWAICSPTGRLSACTAGLHGVETTAIVGVAVALPQPTVPCVSHHSRADIPVCRATHDTSGRHAVSAPPCATLEGENHVEPPKAAAGGAVVERLAVVPESRRPVVAEFRPNVTLACGR